MENNQPIVPGIQKKKSFWRILKTKKFIFGFLAVLFLGYVFFGRGDSTAKDILTETVKTQDLKQTVLATGQVTSQTDLSLSFKVSGRVGRTLAKVGDKVKEGQVLANLDQNDQAARLTQARGALKQAEANYQKVLSGASSEEVQVAQVTLDNAKSTLDITKKQQQVLVDNAYKALLNSGLSAIANPGNTGDTGVTISGVYNDTQTGSYKIAVYSTGSGLRYQVSGLENMDGLIDLTPRPLGTRGLFVQFSSASVPTNNSWTVSVPNTQASTYVTNLNAYNSSLQTQASAISAAENAVASAQASLDLKRAQARPADLEVAQAQVLSAQGQVQAASADLENTLLRAPASGTVTKVDIKPGELATAQKESIILQDVDNLHIEANISEANIVSVKQGQAVEITFDSLGADRKFFAKVSQIDPASTVVSGVVNYKVTISLDKFEEIKPGMTANVSILTGERKSVIAVPQRAVVEKDGKKTVKIVTDPKTKVFREQEIKTGMEADGGLVEIVSGLSGGEEVITFVKTP